MEAPPLERKLAILAADVASYSRRMEIDEEGTRATLTAFRSATDALITRRGGRICGTVGEYGTTDIAAISETRGRPAHGGVKRGMHA